MIDRIVIDNFKSLRHVELQLGRFNLFIGTNASGKSNFLDALRVLQGIGNGFTIGEILDGKPRSATTDVWEGIRGGSAMTCFAGAMQGEVVTLTVHGCTANDAIGNTRFEYSVSFSPAEGKVVREHLQTRSGGFRVAGANVRYYSGREGSRVVKGSSPRGESQPELRQFARGGGLGVVASEPEEAAEVALVLANLQRIDPMPSVVRGYSQANKARRIGERGENFAALVQAIIQDPATENAYLSWLQQLRPNEVDEVVIAHGALGEPLFVLREGVRRYPAPVLSDGTLRFAAIAAGFFQPDMPEIMMIEEIENGIHPSRLRLLVELLRTRAGSGAVQVVATTHSPVVLAWLDEAEYRHTFFCKRDEKTGESLVCALPDVPHFMDVVRKQSIGDLFAEGWLEAAL